MQSSIWEQCLDLLREDKDIPAQKFNTWIRPLHAVFKSNHLVLLAPNQFVMGYVNDNYIIKINDLISSLAKGESFKVSLQIGSKKSEGETSIETPNDAKVTVIETKKNQHIRGASVASHSYIIPTLTFDNFVVGKSNQVARAAAMQIAENPGVAYNPLFLYGGVGLGKTHLMHAIGNYILQHNPNAKILYLHSERFVADMIKALQRNAMNDFKRYYRNLNALFLDDVQFFAGKERSQEELFHTFNSLFDNQQQIVLTCDRYPKEIDGLEERLQSRFGWGLTTAIEPPELETRVAILITKAEEANTSLPKEVAFFIAKHIQSNVRELEGALKRVIANARFTGHAITIDFARDALKDLLTLQAKLINTDNIQKVVAEYYKIKLADLLSKKRNRSLARPRQIAMSLAKELTNHSLPEIGDSFGGRDHTTVLHACRKVKELLASNLDIQEDYKNLLRILSA